MEQYRCRADGKQPVCEFSRCLSGRPKGDVPQVVQQLRSLPPAHHVSHQCGGARKYYITNLLKKPQRVNIRQFVCQVEQLNAYIAQLLCFYYSPNTNASTKPENILFTEAELGSHVLQMCPIQWQDKYNMNEKGMMPMDMLLLLTSLEAIKCICIH